MELVQKNPFKIDGSFLRYTGRLNDSTDCVNALTEFENYLGDFPEPVLYFSDETGPADRGQKNWYHEVLHDQETRFRFDTRHLPIEPDATTFGNALVTAVNDTPCWVMSAERHDQEDIACKLAWKMTTKYSSENPGMILEITLAVYWKEV